MLNKLSLSLLRSSFDICIHYSWFCESISVMASVALKFEQFAGNFLRVLDGDCIQEKIFKICELIIVVAIIEKINQTNIDIKAKLEGQNLTTQNFHDELQVKSNLIIIMQNENSKQKTEISNLKKAHNSME